MPVRTARTIKQYHRERIVALPPRCWLYVPGNRPDRIAKAIGTSADAIIVDLEDACPAAEKESARQRLADLAGEWPTGRCYVRVNAMDSDHALSDLEAVVRPGVAGIVLPKAERAEQLITADWIIEQLERYRQIAPGTITLMPLIETARGISDFDRLISQAPRRVRQVTFGAGDFTTDLGIDWTPSEAELADARRQLVLSSRAYGLEPPIDTPWAHVGDADGLAQSAALARSMGFAGKAAIHPSQIDAIAGAFRPSAEERAEAQHILDAYAAAAGEGSGAFLLDGRLVDYVSVVRARRTLGVDDEAT
jgi:citrate lyase subunit beta / citryl-CoA lyase